MSLGRNEPCPCGSGKKYKKCCLSKDEKARHAGEAAETGAAPQSGKDHASPGRAPDPLVEAWQARWGEFKAADYQNQLALFSRALDDPELMDAEMAFEMLSALFIASAGRGDRDRFDALVESLQERRPEVYLKEKPYFLKWRVTNALLAGRSEIVSALMLELALLAAKDIDIFNRAEERLAYHGLLTALVDAMRLAWPAVKSSSDIVPCGIDEFCNRAVTYELLDHANGISALNHANPALAERLAFFCPIDANRAAAYLADITGGPGRTWTMNDFQFAPPRSDWEDEQEDIEESESGEPSGDLNFYRLTVQFLGYLRRVEGVPYAKGELGRRDLHRFILERQGVLASQSARPDVPGANPVWVRAPFGRSAEGCHPVVSGTPRDLPWGPAGHFHPTRIKLRLTTALMLPGSALFRPMITSTRSERQRPRRRGDPLRHRRRIG